MTATTPRPGRNQPCHCGSGRKYKQCCLARDEAAAAKARQEAAEAAKATAADSAEAEAPTATPHRTPKHQTAQPWKAKSSKGFAPTARMPRRVGGS